MPDKLKIAAISDIHYHKNSKGTLVDLFREVSDTSDVFLLCGDLTDYGRVEEAEVLLEDLANVRIPMLAVLGNHDFETGQPEKIREVLEEGGIRVLDGECVEIEGIGFAGISGFAGGFGRYMLTPWGEAVNKAFVQAAVDEQLKLEEALSQLQTRERIVLMHYAPIRETVEGEPLEILAFLGSSRLEEPVNRYEASIVFHGHAHKGAPEGRTSTGIPVYNVSLPVLRHVYPEKPPFRVYEAKRG